LKQGMTWGVGVGTGTVFHSQTSGFLFHHLNNLHEALGLSPCL